MEQEKDIILTELNKMLETKTFSDPVKEKINYVVSKAYDSYSKCGDKKSFFEQLTSGLSSVSEFRINTRKQLNKKEYITPFLGKCTLGFAFRNRSLVVVTKEENEERTIYHEMIHLTQSESSYYVNKNYFFSKMITTCLIEGEASYYDVDLKKDDEKENIEILKCSGEKLGLISNQSYPFYGMFYELLLDIFGKDIMQKWKNIGPNDDIMPILQESFEKKFSQVPFHIFYLLITKLMIEYFNNLNKEEPLFKNYITSEIERFKQSQMNLESEMEDLMKSLKQMLKDMEENNNILQDEKLLKISYEKNLEEAKQELKAYEESSEYDKETANDWKHDIETTTIEDYRDYLLEKTEEYKRKIEKEKRLLKVQSEEVKTNFFLKLKADSYIDQEYNFLDYYNFLMTLVQSKELKNYRIVNISQEKRQNKY